MIEPRGGEMVEIMGLECQLPPPPPLEEIQGFHLPKHEQKWSRTELPHIPVREIEIVSGEYYKQGELLDWESARREEYIMQTGTDPWELDRSGQPRDVPGIRPDPTFVFPMMEDFRRQELERCDPYAYLKGKESGHWVMINGKPIYLTPFHYFYCNWWKLNTGYPDWRWSDAMRFYHWQYVWEDQNCRGETETSKRGDGKTYRVTSKMYLATIYKKKSRSGIQSKTEPDAAEVFNVNLVEPYKDLPDFFIPINSSGTDPQKNIKFFAPTKRGKSAAANRIIQKTAIRSTIDYKNSKENAYDGATINGVLIRDEEGKTTEANVAERHSVTENCVYRDGRVVGKIASTTTVERWEKGGENFKRIWDGSNPAHRNELGETRTKLYKLWLPAYITEFQDEFGFPDEERARRVQGIRRRDLRNDPEALQQYILQFPWTEEEMFAVDGQYCQYNREVLRERERFVNDPDFNLIRRGHFKPKNEDDLREGIYWEDDELTGRWEVSRFLDEKEANNFLTFERAGGTVFKPNNMEGFCGGFDPTKTHGDPEKVRSFAGGAILEKEQFWNPAGTPNFVADYVWQPDDPEQAYMDMLYGCMYYGCQFLPESNLGIGSTLRRAGCEDFIMSRPEPTYNDERKAKLDELGLPATVHSNDLLLKKKKTWMYLYANRLIQPRIIRTSIQYNPAKRTKFDLEVATQLAIMGTEKYVEPKKKPKDLSSMFQSFNNSGSYGEIN